MTTKIKYKDKEYNLEDSEALLINVLMDLNNTLKKYGKSGH